MEVLRYIVFGVFAYASGVALGSWALRSRYLNPFRGVGKLVRRISDPVMKPVERLVVRRGGNPQNAEWWLLGITVLGGILVISLSDWVIGQVTAVNRSVGSGPRGIARVVVYYSMQILTIAILIRVIGSWFGVGRFNRFMRVFYQLTDWIIEPLRKVIPPIGMIDITPIVAYFGLQFLAGFIMSLL